jgi:hypothetical protein
MDVKYLTCFEEKESSFSFWKAIYCRNRMRREKVVVGRFATYVSHVIL